MKKLLLAFAMWLSVSGAALAVVNINTATKEELTTLKGVGDKRAQEIIDYRKKHGNFKSVDDLEKVPGIGPGLMKQIRSSVTVTGKTSIDKSAAKATEPAKSDTTKSGTSTSKTAEKAKAEEKKVEKK